MRAIMYVIFIIITYSFYDPDLSSQVPVNIVILTTGFLICMEVAFSASDIVGAIKDKKCESK